jgi:hypothetical protein
VHLVCLQADLYLRREPLLADGRPCRGRVPRHIPVLRLARRFRRLHLPRVSGQGVLRAAVSSWVLVPAVGVGVLGGVAARGPGGAWWMLVLLVLSAALTAIAQQTLP